MKAKGTEQKQLADNSMDVNTKSRRALAYLFAVAKNIFCFQKLGSVVLFVSALSGAFQTLNINIPRLEIISYIDCASNGLVFQNILGLFRQKPLKKGKI